MAVVFQVIVSGGRPSPIIFQNVHGKLGVVIAVKNINTVNHDFVANDEKGTLLFAPSLQKGQSIASSVPATTKTVLLVVANPNFGIKAEVQIEI